MDGLLGGDMVVGCHDFYGSSAANQMAAKPNPELREFPPRLNVLEPKLTSTKPSIPLPQRSHPAIIDSQFAQSHKLAIMVSHTRVRRRLCPRSQLIAHIGNSLSEARSTGKLDPEPATLPRPRTTNTMRLTGILTAAPSSSETMPCWAQSSARASPLKCTSRAPYRIHRFKKFKDSNADTTGINRGFNRTMDKIWDWNNRGVRDDTLLISRGADARMLTADGHAASMEGHPS